MASRFRSGADWFVHSTLGGIHTLRIGANSDRAVDLVHALAARLPAEIHVSIESVRERQAWSGGNVSRADTRDVLARLKLLLASYGGVEIALYSSDDQLTLTPELEVVVYSRIDRWSRRLKALGLEEREAAPALVWRPNRHSLAPVPELAEALGAAVERLGLASASLDIERP